RAVNGTSMEAESISRRARSFCRRLALYIVIHELEPESLRVGHEEGAGRRADEHRRIRAAQGMEPVRVNPPDDHIVVPAHEQKVSRAGVLDVGTLEARVVMLILDELHHDRGARHERHREPKATVYARQLLVRRIAEPGRTHPEAEIGPDQMPIHS